MRKLVLAAVVIAIAGCAEKTAAPTAESSSTAGSTPTAKSLPVEEHYQLIVRVEGRAGVTLIESGPHGVVYTVKDRDRQVLVNRATLAQVKEKNPALGEELEHTVVDAGCDSSRIRADVISLPDAFPR